MREASDYGPTGTPESAGRANGNAYAFPTTFSQKRLWFLDQLEPGNTSYSIPWAIRITGELHLPALESSVNEIVRRHEVLRTVFKAVDGEPLQVVLEFLRVPFTLEDLTHLPFEEREKEVRRLTSEEARRPLD